MTSSLSHRGFFYDGLTFTQYDVPGATYTDVRGVNDTGDFCGYYSISPFGIGPYTAFVNIGSTLVTFTVPGANSVYAMALNNRGQVVGDYQDDRNRYHGFFRAADGTLTYPIDAPGARVTFIDGINDKGIMVGSYKNTSGTFAFIFKLPRNFIAYQYPDHEARGQSFWGHQ
jgi:hypothetical protein